MKLTLTAGGQTRTLRIVRRGNQVRVQFEDGREAVVRLLSDGGGVFELEHGHERIHGAGVVHGLQRQLWVNGHQLAYVCQTSRTTPEDTAERSLASALPGVILEILVAEGETVKSGQKLVLLESMKTVITIQAPRDGVIGSVLCAPGEAVPAGVPLLELGP